MEELRERMARIEGAFEQMNHRMNELREQMNQRMGELRWEVRIWFLVLLVVMTIYHFVR